MATDATGTPTSPDSIPTYNTAGDPPSGKGFNAAMAAIQTALSARVGKPAGVVAGEVPVWNGTTWVRGSQGDINNAAVVSGANTDLATPTAPESYWAISSGGGTLRSIGAPTYTSMGARLILRNGSATAVTLKHGLAGGTGSQLYLRNQVDQLLLPSDEVEFVYNTANWVEINRNKTMPSCILRHSATVSAGNNGNGTGSYVFHPFDTEIYDPYGMHDPVTNNSRVNILETGVYGYYARVHWQANVSGYRSIAIYANGVSLIDLDQQQVANTTVDQSEQLTGVYNLTAGDYLQVGAYQNSGVALNINGGQAYTPNFKVWRIA